MNQREIVALVVFLLFVTLVTITVRSVRQRGKQEALLLPTASSISTNAPLLQARCQYVSTVLASEPLRRFGGKQLLFRGAAELFIFDDFVLIERDGETALQILRKDLVEVGRASASIDRAVERDGLLSLTWLAKSTLVTTNLRLAASDDTIQFQDKISSLIAREIKQ